MVSTSPRRRDPGPPRSRAVTPAVQRSRLKSRRGKPFQARAPREHGCFTRVTRLYKVWSADGRGNRIEPRRRATSLTGQHRHAQGRGFWKAPLGRAVPEPHAARRPSALAAPGVSDADAGGAAVGSPSRMPGHLPRARCRGNHDPGRDARGPAWVFLHVGQTGPYTRGTAGRHPGRPPPSCQGPTRALGRGSGPGSREHGQQRPPTHLA